MKTEAKIGVTWPQAKGPPEPPGAGRGRREPPLGPWEGAWPGHTWTSHLRPLEAAREEASAIFSVRLAVTRYGGSSKATHPQYTFLFKF